MVQQIAQLSLLTAVHFLIDSFGGLAPVLLPEIRSRFALSFTQGVALLTVLNLTCNIMQVFTGHLRSEKRKPLFISIGIMVASLICLMAFLPQSGAFYSLCVLFFIAGCGIAITHPEGLRAIHTLEELPSPVTTAVFMTGGFLGFAGGGYLAAQVVTRLGFEKIVVGIAVAAVLVVLVYVFKIRLAVESDEESAGANGDLAQSSERFSFLPLLIMSLPTTIASTVLVGMLPSMLEELEFDLRFGGASVLIFGIGSAVGALFWSVIAHKKGVMKTAVWALFMGVPFLVAYQFTITSHAACWFLIGAGFMSGSAFSLIITLCRNAYGLKLGQRMGFIVGGSWGIASLVMFLLAKPAEIFGIWAIFWIVPSGYAVSAAIGVWILISNNSKRKQVSYAENG